MPLPVTTIPQAKSCFVIWLLTRLVFAMVLWITLSFHTLVL